jgi:CD63 antigen
MDGCCESLVKYILVLFNFIFAITGMALIGIGAYVKIQAEHYLDFVGTGYVNTPIFIIIVGVVIFVIAFFGCWGACTQNPCMIYTYAVILCVILIAEVAAGIAAFVLKNDLRTEVEKNMKAAMENYGGDDAGGVTGTWDAVQRDLKCCGVRNMTDWTEKLPAKFGPQETPDSCCKKTPEVVGCGKDKTAPKFERGCLDVFENEFLSNIGIVGGVALAIAFVQAIGVCCACCIGRKIREQSGYV